MAKRKTLKQLVTEAINSVKDEKNAGTNKVAFVLGYVNGGGNRIGRDNLDTLVGWLCDTAEGDSRE